MSDDWVATTDPNSGKTYYFNKKTRETSWKNPHPEPAPSAAATAADGAGPDPSQDEWKEVEDKNSGKCYYYNRRTKETTWQKPTVGKIIPAKRDPPAGTGDAAAATAAAATAAAADPVSPRVAVLPTASNEMVSPRPDPPAIVSPRPDPPAASPASPRSTPAPEDDDEDQYWREAKDPASGRTYYYNKKTKQTLWKDPRKNKPESAAAASPAVAPTSPAVTPASPPTNAVSPSSSGALSPRAASPPLSNQSSADMPKIAAKIFANEMKDAKSAAADDEDEDKEDDEQAADNILKRQHTQEQEKKHISAILNEDEAGSDDDEEFSFLFAKHRHGFFNRAFRTGKVLDNEQIMSFKKSMIKKALLKQNRALDAEAVQCFKNIMSYMGDRDSSKQGFDHVTKLLSNVMSSPVGLRDEVFLQLCKQTTGNPKDSSVLLGWEMMVFALNTFPPSKPLRKFLLAYFDENKDNKETQLSEATRQQISQFATFCADTLPKIMAVGQRKEVPSIQELDCLKQLKQVSIRVHFVDDTFKTMMVDSFTTAAEVEEMMIKKLALKCTEPFSLYEYSKEHSQTDAAVISTGERIMHAKERVLDRVAAWEHADTKSKEKDSKDTTVTESKLVFKAKLVLKAENEQIKSDAEAINLLYVQSVHDVVSGQYPVKDTHLAVLAALQLQATFGDYVDEMHGHGWLLDKLEQYMPSDMVKDKKKKIEESKRAEWEQKIIHKYEKLKGFTPLEAKLNYLDYVQQWDYYGVTFFYVQQRQFKDYPAILILGITCEGALLLHPDTKAKLDMYKYTDIVTWGHSDEKFILVVGNVVQQRKLVFKTTKGSQINTLVHDYVKFKVAHK